MSKKINADNINSMNVVKTKGGLDNGNNIQLLTYLCLLKNSSLYVELVPQIDFENATSDGDETFRLRYFD